MEACLLISLFIFNTFPFLLSLPSQKFYTTYSLVEVKILSEPEALGPCSHERWEIPVSCSTCLIDHGDVLWNVKSDFMRIDRIL